MAIQVTCSGCHARFKVSDKYAGRKGPCPKCKAEITVPDADEEVVIKSHDEFGGARDAGGERLATAWRHQHAVPLRLSHPGCQVVRHHLGSTDVRQERVGVEADSRGRPAGHRDSLPGNRHACRPRGRVAGMLAETPQTGKTDPTPLSPGHCVILTISTRVNLPPVKFRGGQPC